MRGTCGTFWGFARFLDRATEELGNVIRNEYRIMNGTLGETQRQRLLAAQNEFFSLSLDEVLSRHRRRSPQQAVLALFHEVVATVPAYAAFLNAQGIDPAMVRTVAEFERLPLTNKPDYLRRYPLAELCRGGRLENCDFIAVSSGSTGEPGFWPRSVGDEYAIARRFEQVFDDSFQADRRRTLAVVCFSLGTWVGGMFTAACCRHLAAKGYPITTITPGHHPEEIFRVLERLAPAFEQVVLLGYPPFLKDVVDRGIARGLDWSRFAVKLVFAGEVFSEEWRDLVHERVGARSIHHDSAALYGTADAGVLGNETPLSICIRRYLAANPAAAHALFGESRLPTLVQYDPLSRYFECVDGTLLFSGDNGVPLVRYHIADRGGLITYPAMRRFLADWHFDPVATLRAHAPEAPLRGVRELPFVYVFGRADFTVSYFGANIYPENVSVGLEQPGVREWTTGKFVLQVQEDADRNRRWSIMIELAPNESASESRRRAATDAILTHLVRLNSEFAHYVPAEYRIPRVELLPTGDPTYFPSGVKHRYTRR